MFYVPESNACVEHLSRVDGVPYQVVDFAEFLREPQPKVMLSLIHIWPFYGVPWADKPSQHSTFFAKNGKSIECCDGLC